MTLEFATPVFPRRFLPLASAANVGKSVGLATYVACTPAFQRSFACNENLADLNAKGQARPLQAAMALAPVRPELPQHARLWHPAVPECIDVKPVMQGWWLQQPAQPASRCRAHGLQGSMQGRACRQQAVRRQQPPATGSVQPGTQAQAMVMDTLGLAISVALIRAFRHSPRALFLLPFAVGALTQISLAHAQGVPGCMCSHILL